MPFACPALVRVKHSTRLRVTFEGVPSWRPKHYCAIMSVISPPPFPTHPPVARVAAVPAEPGRLCPRWLSASQRQRPSPRRRRGTARFRRRDAPSPEPRKKRRNFAPRQRGSTGRRRGRGGRERRHSSPAFRRPRRQLSVRSGRQGRERPTEGWAAVRRARGGALLVDAFGGKSARL